MFTSLNFSFHKRADETFVNGAKSRSLIFEVERKIHESAKQVLHRIYITEQGQLGMTVMPSEGATKIVSVLEDRLAELHGLCEGDVLCKPFTQGKEILNTYKWFMEVVKHRPLIFDVWRSSSKRPLTRPVGILEKKKNFQNPFVWQIGKLNNK